MELHSKPISTENTHLADKLAVSYLPTNLQSKRAVYHVYHMPLVYSTIFDVPDLNSKFTTQNGTWLTESIWERKVKITIRHAAHYNNISADAHTIFIFIARQSNTMQWQCSSFVQNPTTDHYTYSMRFIIRLAEMLDEAKWPTPRPTLQDVAEVEAKGRTLRPMPRPR